MKSMELSDSRNTDERFCLLKDKIHVSKGFYTRVDRYTILEYRGNESKRLFYPSPSAMREINSLLQQTDALSSGFQWVVAQYKKLKEEGSGELIRFVNTKNLAMKKQLKTKGKKQLNVKGIYNEIKETEVKGKKRLKLSAREVSNKKKIKAKNNTNRRSLHSK